MKKNNLILMIVTISIFVVLLMGATYAYFASNTNTGNGLDFSATLDDNNIAFTATSGTLSLHVAAENMLQSQVGQGDVLAAESVGEENIAITLSSNTETPIACTYNVYFQWNNGQAYLTPTNANKNEFTLELDLQDSDGTGSEGTNKFASETQLTRVITSTNKTLIVEGASIVGSSADSGSQTWVPTAKFYNLTDDQSALAGSTFGGKFTIEDVECSPVDHSLSGIVLSLESNSEYESSQTDGDVYIVRREEIINALENTTYTKITNYGNEDPVIYQSNGTHVSGQQNLAPGTFTMAADGTWSNVPSSMNFDDIYSYNYYQLHLPIMEDAYYQICYEMDENDDSNQLYIIALDGIYSDVADFEMSIDSQERSGCKNLGYLTEDKIVRVVDYVASGAKDLSFYLQKTNNVDVLNVGVRYEGKDPDNYVTFNGEEAGWRIIGTFEGSTIGLEPGKQYTKIVKAAFDETGYWDRETDAETGDFVNGTDWELSGINYFFNGTYLDSLLDKTKIAKYNGDYSTWHLGSVESEDSSYRAIDYYLAERGIIGAAAAPTKLRYKNAIGLMYPSDFAYAIYGGNENTECNNQKAWIYENWCGDFSWLLGEDHSDEWSIMSSSIDKNAAHVISLYNNWGSDGAGSDYYIRPTLYLEYDVEVVDGTGTQEDPYILN